MSIDKTIEITVILLILFLIIKTNPKTLNMFGISSNNIIDSMKKILSDSADVLYEVPIQIKCILNEPSCSQNNLTKEILIKSLIFMLYGYIFPQNITSAIIASIGIQLINLNLGLNLNLAVDVLSNMTGFFIGRTFSPSQQSILENKYQVILS